MGLKGAAIRAILALFGLLAPESVMAATPHVGDVYQIQRINETSSEGANGSNGSTYDKDTIVARVIAVREGGLELEYDLPPDATKEDRASAWQYPVRVFRPVEGLMKLLNSDQLEARVDAWLKEAKWTREVCGHWIFTWNAFRVDCDPQSAIGTLEIFDPALDQVHAGAPYGDPAAVAPAPLTLQTFGPKGDTFTVELAINPDKARSESAETDLVVAEISRKPLTREQAVAIHSADHISGTIIIKLDTDPAGNVQRRVRVTKVSVEKPTGEKEDTTTTETLERRLIRHG